MSAPEDPRPFPLHAAVEPTAVRLDTRRRADPDAATASALGEELRAVLTQTEDHVDLLRGTAAELRAVLPTRVEAAVSRALAGGDGASVPRRLAELGETCDRTAAAVELLGRDLLAERLSRAEDREVLVDLVSAATAEVRADVRGLEQQVADLGAIVAGLAVTVRALGPALAAVSTKLDRPLAVTVEARPTTRTASAPPPRVGGSAPADLGRG